MGVRAAPVRAHLSCDTSITQFTIVRIVQTLQFTADPQTVCSWQASTHRGANFTAADAAIKSATTGRDPDYLRGASPEARSGIPLTLPLSCPQAVLLPLQLIPVLNQAIQ
jgi:hypothetical protein